MFNSVPVPSICPGGSQIYTQMRVRIWLHNSRHLQSDECKFKLCRVLVLMLLVIGVKVMAETKDNPKAAVSMDNGGSAPRLASSTSVNTDTGTADDGSAKSRVSSSAPAVGGEHSSSDNEDDPSVQSLQDRLKRYLTLNKSPNTSLSDISVNAGTDTIRSIRFGMLDAPGLHGGTASIPVDIGNFRPFGKVRGPSHFEKIIFSKKQIVGLSFNPENMICGSCSGVQHRVLTNELVDLFLDLTRGCRIPAGSVVMKGSLTHLANVGLGAYAEDLSKAAAKMGRIFQQGLVVLPGLLFPPDPVNDPMLAKQIFDATIWAKNVAKLSDGGLGILNS
jgi:hypothetical protein